MTRDEIKVQIALSIAKQAIESGNIDTDLSWLNIEELLKELENADIIKSEVVLT